MNGRGTGAGWSADKLLNAKLKLHTINVPKHRNLGQLTHWCWHLAFPSNTCKMAPSLRSHPSSSQRQGEETIFTQPLTTLTKINRSKTWGQSSSWYSSLPGTSGTLEAEEKSSEKSRPQEFEVITWPQVKDQDLLAFSFSTLISLTPRKTLS